MRAWTLVSIAVFLVLAFLAWPFTVDDAYIIARYAKNIVAGDGYAMNPGAPSDGVTGPLWLLPAIVGAKFGDPIVVQKLASLIAAALAFVWMLRRLEGREQVFAALLLWAQPTFAIWAVAGLETGAATLLLTAIAFLASRKSARPVLLGACAAALFFLRPEAVPAAGVAVLWLRSDRRALAQATAGLVAGGVLIALFRYAMFGTVVPLSYYAKPVGVIEGAPYVLRGLFVSTGIVGAVVAGFAAKRGRAERVVGSIALTHLVSVMIAGGCWMPGFRLLVPILPLYAWLGARALGGVERAWWRRGLFALSLAVPLLNCVAQYPQLANTRESREIEGRMLAERLSGTVALVDAGFLPYVSGVEVVDLGGVTDPRVGRASGGHLDKDIDAGYLASRDPDFIVLHTTRPPTVEDKQLATLHGYPVERRVAQLPWVRANFEVDAVMPYAPGYWYVVLARRER